MLDGDKKIHDNYIKCLHYSEKITIWLIMS